MEKRNYKLINKKLQWIQIKILIILILSFFCAQYSFSTDYDYIDVWPYEIKFNYEPGNSNDAITIKKDVDTSIPVPEWNYPDSSEKFAYIKGQSNRKIQVRFDSDCDSMHLLINLGVYEGTGIGVVCNLFIENYNKFDWVTLTLEGSVPNYVDMKSFTWEWEIYAIPKDPTYCSKINERYTSHTYYTLLATPQSPMSTPWTEVLDYACVWASGKSDAGDVCTDILNNGFYAHYTWDYDCYDLSSDFVRLVTSLGISASQHRWASKGFNCNVGDMAQQQTDSIDPVGYHGLGEYEWQFHQWSEAASSQRDPSFNKSKSGLWGGYEDYLFAEYLEKISSSTFEWVSNNEGHDSGCERPQHRYYSNPEVLDWRGPD